MTDAGWSFDLPQTSQHRLNWRPHKTDKLCSEQWGTTDPKIPCELRKEHEGNHVGTIPSKGFRND